MLTIHRDIAGPCLAPGGSVLAIGAFDGLHRGHAALLDAVRKRASERAWIAAVVSFEPLPRSFFAPAPVERLSSVREKLVGFADAGIEKLLLLRFDAGLAAMHAEAFVRQALIARMGASEIWVGEDFHFGHQRAGNVELLRAMRSEGHYEVRVLNPVLDSDGERVSASRVRSALAEGDFAKAKALLGRPFTIGGCVACGKRLGRSLGIPTANIRLGRRAAPVAGVFAVRVHGVGRAARPGVANLGVRPTVTGSGEPLLETFLFDFDGDLYGQRLEVEFVVKLRDEAKFTGLAALKAQMERDVACARAVLDTASGRSP